MEFMLPTYLLTGASIMFVVMTILLGGMLRRERQCPAGIGWESVLLLVTYMVTLILMT
jgi:hypothetical protein